MSLTSSFSNALSGLTASSRAAQVVSSNIANSLTEGYATREISLSSQSLGGNGAGVLVEGVYRNVDPSLLADRRVSQAELGNASVISEFLTELEKSIGIPEDAGSLNSELNAFETSLIEAASRPDSTPRLNAVVQAANGVTAKFNKISNDIQSLRLTADNEIASQVNFLNDSLQKIEALNTQVLAQTAAGRDATALMDQRQAMVDQIAEIVPLKQVEKDKNTIALISTGGAVLLDGRAGEFRFTSVSTIVPEMTLETGALSGISLNGYAINTSAERNALNGGSLAALFEVRDEIATQAQGDLDAMARNLIERFADPVVDGTSTGGLFTDAGTNLDPLNEAALSSRISVAPIADPTQGGAAWRVRDGLGAVTTGELGNAARIQSMIDQLQQPISPSSGSFSSEARSLNDLSADFLSSVGIARQSRENDVAFATTKTVALQAQEKANGVDSDQEMQKLLVVERSYSANAKVIQTIDQMLDLLMGL
ncbi:flagellar hook-associated protein FlgK [Falsihalocynthiibacter sp. SS001]|uniref:flagellar hook-associated protein FlgK n=1 Tax=Falsihalocynthiibacter sp. SS001 TaxID=3349698 RepID=UPI0036D2CA59